MPHIISYTEEIEEHGYCQQRPELTTGEKYLHEVDGQKRLRIVKSVHLVKYVWENVVQWSVIASLQSCQGSSHNIKRENSG